VPVLERERGLGGAPEVGRPALDEAAARRNLREQIARLDAQLGAAVSAGFPHLHPGCPPVTRAGGGRLLDLGALEHVRDELAERLRTLRLEADALGARQVASRRLLEGMLLEPGRHHWAQVSAADLGEPGCQRWQVRPRLGLLGMLMGWWRVKLSSGCPLATGHRRSPGPAVDSPAWTTRRSSPTRAVRSRC
jgi:hypothetical protein